MKENDSFPGRSLRVIRNLEVRQPGLNLALEEAISKQVSSFRFPPTVRFWRNDYSVILGRSQRAKTEAHLPDCRTNNVPVLRRASGGGAVLHHPGNLNYTLYLPETDSTSVRESALDLNEVACSGLDGLGITGRVQPNGLFVGSAKLGGTAQSRRWGLLHHGTLLVEDSPIMDNMGDFLRAQSEEYEDLNLQLPSKPSPVVNLRRLIGKKVEIPVVVDSLIESFACYFDLIPRSGHVSLEEWRLALSLLETKYSSRNWNFRFENKQKSPGGE